MDEERVRKIEQFLQEHGSARMELLEPDGYAIVSIGEVRALEIQLADLSELIRIGKVVVAGTLGQQVYSLAGGPK